MRVLDLFSGIGGFSLGLERAGFKTVAFCEIEEFPRKVLKKHWPDVPIYKDIRQLTAEKLRHDGIGPIDVICGGFPCQDISFAGKGEGIAGERSGLWKDYARIISEVRPRFAIMENVAALLNRGLGDVLADLAEIGYDAEWHCIPASYVGAPHRRDRIWIIAYAEGERRTETRGFRRDKQQERICGSSEEGYFADFIIKRLQGIGEGSIQGFEGFSWCENVGGIEDLLRRSNIHTPALCRASDGIPDWVDRTKALGNSVVPQIPELIGRAIKQAIS